MKSVCENCDMGLNRKDCSEAEYIECETRKWIGEYLNSFNSDGLVNIIESEFSKIIETYPYKKRNLSTKELLLDIAQFCIDRSRHYK